MKTSKIQIPSPLPAPERPPTILGERERESIYNGFFKMTTTLYGNFFFKEKKNKTPTFASLHISQNIILLYSALVHLLREHKKNKERRMEIIIINI